MDSKFKKISYILIVLAIIGFIDSLYLLISHYVNSSVSCSEFSNCDLVLTSEYATIFGIPVALLGVLFYAFILLVTTIFLDKNKIILLKVIILSSVFGLLASAWFVYLQAFVIYSYCDYCLVSALVSTLIFVVSIFTYFKFIYKKEL